MPMIKASKLWNKPSLSPSIILVKRPVCLCLDPPSITCMHIHVDKYILNVHKVVSKLMNLRTHTHIYIKLQLLVIKNFCTIKLGFICKYIALKQ